MIPPDYLNQIVTGDARTLAERIPDASIDLIFTDPVYDRIEDYAWLAETAARVLKPHGSCLAFCAHQRTLQAGAVMLPFLDGGPVLEHYVTGPLGRLFSHSCQSNVIPCLWFSRGVPNNEWMALQQASYIDGARGHKWGKNQQMIRYRLVKFTKPTSIVFDPFSGGGTIPAVCKMTGRNYIAFEIDAPTAERARLRVANTQAMHPIFLEEQHAMELAS